MKALTKLSMHRLMWQRFLVNPEINTRGSPPDLTHNSDRVPHKGHTNSNNSEDDQLIEELVEEVLRRDLEDLKKVGAVKARRRPEDSKPWRLLKTSVG